MAADDLTIRERLTIQMQYVVPLVRDLQDILGEDVVNAALEERITRQLERARSRPAPTLDLRQMAEGTRAYAAGDSLEYEVVAVEADRFDMNVTRCAYAAMMEGLQARDIGHLLICGLDFPMAAESGAELTRTQTCMQGASHCDFRYRRRSE